jgi:hypothetical protein
MSSRSHQKHAVISARGMTFVSHQFGTPLTSLRPAVHLLPEERVGTLKDKQAELMPAASVILPRGAGR